MSGIPQIQPFTEPDEQVRAAALTIQDAAARTDSAAPFDEHTLLSLDPRPGTGSGQRHLLLTVDGAPAGYAHLDLARPGEPGEAELAIHPQARRLGHGTALISALAGVHHQTRPGREPLQIWSHGDQPAARVLAGQLGYVVVRALLQLRRSMDHPVPEPKLPQGVVLRSFRPGADDAAWLRLNARAFAHHPEQGRMTQADLDARMAEPWFDPQGFLIAEQDGEMTGFHWTKIHASSPAGDPGQSRLGEVYVLGVDPDRHGGGLGTALTLAGLRSLRERGATAVLLYVESDNEPALAVYRRLEFQLWSTDVMYRSMDRP